MGNEELELEIAAKGIEQVLREKYIERIKEIAPELPEEHYESALKLIDNAYVQGMCGGFSQALQEFCSAPAALADVMASLKWRGSGLYD